MVVFEHKHCDGAFSVNLATSSGDLKDDGSIDSESTSRPLFRRAAALLLAHGYIVRHRGEGDITFTLPWRRSER